MVKKIFFALILINLIGVLKVNAQQLSPPTFFQHFDDGSTSSPTIASTSDNWSQTNVYVGGYIGSFGTNFSNIYQVDYNWFDLNICTGKNVSISGSVHAIYGFFFNQNYSISFYMNSQPLTCSTSVFDSGNALHYDCFGETGGGTFAIYLTENTFTNNVNYNTAVSKDVNYSCDVSNEAIVNQSITNTQNIINNQNQNTQDIIDNQNQNTQDIIDNQNQNTQQEIESQKVCSSSLSFTLTKGKAFDNNGNLFNASSYYYTSDYILVPPSSLIQFNILDFEYASNSKIILYNENYNYLDYYSLNTYNKSFNTTSNTKYIRFSYIKDTGISIFSSVPVCQNGNQALNDSVNDLNDTLNDTSQPNTNQDINDMNGMVASDTPISDLITMPLTLINAYINGVNSSCSPVNLGNLYGTDLILPCINLEQRLGSNLWHIIDAFFSIFMCYNIGMLFVSAFDGITSLRDDFEGLYQPRHADTGYQPKHGGN